MSTRRARSSIHCFVTGLLTAILLAGSGGLAGCATIMSEGGGDRPVTISTNPPGATIFVKHGASDWQQQPGVTPTEIRLDPTEDSDYQLRLELEGYEPIFAYVGTEVDPWLIGSIALIVVFVIPGVVATAVDFATGAWKKLDEDHLYFDFTSRATTQP